MSSDTAADFVARDRELESANEKTTEQLAAHRWHWTLDETNPDRVSMSEYGRRVGRSQKAIRKIVNGYVAWKARTSSYAPGAPSTLVEFIEHAALGAETAEAVAAVAAVSGKSFTTVATKGREEVKSVVDTARERAERKGTTVSEEIPAVAEWREKGRKARSSEKAARREMRTFTLVEFEGHIGKASRELRKALTIAREVDFDVEETEILEDAIAKLKTIVQLIDVRITGETGIDWEEEFAEIMGGD